MTDVHNPQFPTNGKVTIVQLSHHNEVTRDNLTLLITDICTYVCTHIHVYIYTCHLRHTGTGQRREWGAVVGLVP